MLVTPGSERVNATRKGHNKDLQILHEQKMLGNGQIIILLSIEITCK